MTPPPIESDSSVSPKGEIWFLRVCHLISNAIYILYCHSLLTSWRIVLYPVQPVVLRRSRIQIRNEPHANITSNAYTYRSAEKSLARPGRKQAIVTNLQLLQATQKKKKIQNVVRPTRSPRQQWPPRRTKNGDLTIVFFSRVGLRIYQYPCNCRIRDVNYLCNNAKWWLHEMWVLFPFHL